MLEKALKQLYVIIYIIVMSFSKNSEVLMKYFLNDFDKFSKKITSKNQEALDKIFKQFWWDIKISNGLIERYDKQDMLKTEFIEKKKYTELFESKFVPTSVKSYTERNMKGYLIVKTVLGCVEVEVIYAFFKKSEVNNLKKAKNRIKKALRILRFLLFYVGTSNKVKKITINLYLTNIKKTLPKNQIKILNEENCNSALTYACAEEGEVLVFREEEWKKVLIHELFHSLCLDFSGISYLLLKDKMKDLLKVNSDYEISEAYAEYWATILNSCFISFDILDDKEDYEQFGLYSEFCIQFERIFSMFQLVKVLDYMGLRYKDLVSDGRMAKSLKNILYKEDTNVLAYYIIKAVLLCDYDKFLFWCEKYNISVIKFDKNQLNLRRFGNYFEEMYKNRRLTKSINDMEIKYIKLRGEYKNPNKDTINVTTRMTICEDKV